MGFIVLKVLAAFEAQHFDFSNALEHIHEGVDSRPHAALGQHTDIGGLDHKKHQLTVAGHQRMVGDVGDTHELAGGRLFFGVIFLFSAHKFIFLSAELTAACAAEQIPQWLWS